jgi:uncharacterized repeat protein (TIGR03803 family)
MMSLAKWKKVQITLLLGAATAMVAHAQTFTTLMEFNGVDGGGVGSQMVQGADGNIYGTTGAGANGRGSVFKLTELGWATLYSFCSLPNCADGWGPNAGLIQARDGNFYGVTTYGGSGGQNFDGGGTLFRIGAKGALTVLYNFCSQPSCADGMWPFGGLTQGSDGNLYGTTQSGGDATCNRPYGCGTVYKITLDGQFTKLHTFEFADGRGPAGNLVQGSDGNFYGTTVQGGENGDNGTIFRITPAGLLTTVHNFDNTTFYPLGLVLATDGNGYGTTGSGGPYGYGTVFKVTPNGALTTIYAFDGTTTGGGRGAGWLTQGTDGNLYGSDPGGTAQDIYGSIFSVTLDGALTSLHTFGGRRDGSRPLGLLLQDTNGSFYGAATTGGSKNYGTFFTLDVGLNPFVTLVRPAEKVGETESIIGQGFTGTTSVAFNGTSASFTVVSDTFMKAIVPSGATSGYVTVATPSGVLSSSRPFRVIP